MLGAPILSYSLAYHTERSQLHFGVGTIIFQVYIPQNTEETEAQRSQGTGPESHSQLVVEPEFKFQSLCLEPLVVLSPSFFLWQVLRFREAKRLLKLTE